MFTTHLKQALNILTDGNPWSNWAGYSKLFNISIMASHDDHVRAAQSFLDWEVESAKFKEIFKAQCPEDTSTESDADTPGPTRNEIIRSLSPAGQSKIQCCNCGFTPKRAQDLHSCRMCLNVGFCNDCIKIIKAGQGRFMHCNLQHDFFYESAASEKLPQGIVRYKGKQILTSEWLEELKRDWDL